MLFLFFHFFSSTKLLHSACLFFNANFLFDFRLLHLHIFTLILTSLRLRSTWQMLLGIYVFSFCPITYQISVCRFALHLQRFNLHLGQQWPSAVHTVLSVSQWMVPNSRLYKPMGEMIFLLSTLRIEACKLLQASFSLSKLPWQGNEQVDSALAYLWESCTLKGL